jgi:hypothetical protein
MKKADIQRLLMKMSVGEDQVLSLMVSRSGALNSMGDGNPGSEVRELVMGQTDEPLFDELLQAIPDEWMAHTGRYEMPEIKGARCELSVALEGETEETGFAFTFGTQSDGAPEEFVDLVEMAMEMTDEWYQANRKPQQRK